MDLIITILPVVTKDLPISPRFTPYDFFYRDASSAILQLVNQWLNFTYSRSHAFRYGRKNTNPAGKNRTHDFRTSRCAGYPLDHVLFFAFIGAIKKSYSKPHHLPYSASPICANPQTRIALSILMSCLIYDHPVTELGLIGMLLVFAAVFYRINRRMQGKKLLTWEGMDDSKGMDMFHEWHEHLDL